MSQIKSSWSKMPTNSKIGFSLGMLVIIALAIFLSMNFLLKEQDVLFSDLADADAANVVNGLKELKLDYQLTNNGKTILVAKDQVHETRLNLMSQGVMLNNTVGLELFDNADYGMTEFAQKVNFQRALQGEIARTIIALQEVKYARVHLTLPENSIFADQQTSAKAAVTILNEEGLMLSKQQIIGIQRLVSSSVAGLPVDNVVIVDERGVDISVQTQTSEDSEMALSGSDILERKQAYEKHLSEKVEHILTKSIGFGSFAVSIDVNFDYSKTTLLSENLLKPEKHKNGFLKQEKTHIKYGDKADKKGDVKKNKSSEEKTAEYLYGKEVKQTEYFSGAVTGISVAVIVTTSISEEQLANIQQVVAAAVGLNTERGDSVKVYHIKPTEKVKANVPEKTHFEQPQLPIIDSVNDDLPQQSVKQLSENQMVMIIVVLILFVFITTFFWLQGRKKNQIRQELLDEIKLWVNEDKTTQEVLSNNA